MKTDDLISMLAASATPVPTHVASRRLLTALLVGLPLSFVFMQWVFGLRRDLMEVMTWPMFWVRLLFPVCIAAGAYLMVERLSRPGVKVRKAWLGLAVPVLVVWGMAAYMLVSAPAEERPALVMGQTWRTCTANIAFVALPVFVAALVALKGLAPTRPALAGAAAGLMAGGAGAAIYALHCVELAAPFFAVWYVLGISLPAVVGALIGSRFLRW
ncbi:DUF1109 domain-containing protein [Variovorax sp. YR216]|uniref:DUF1109 domain-containing protein n=1 Tax=Variovorax sp. YR216 TaxID=1882828 RepID=UPI000897514B|nr:DUF1109 domain-containing protein [Variovorax sp. YR216]SEA07326.1 hypothetical protein SAMN05444680_101416 [Variovorax sp. YR216]